MSRRQLTVTFYNAHAAYISGHGTRELITELKGRPPVWASRHRAWVVSEQTARDVLAMSQARGWDVHVAEAGDAA